MKILAPMPGTIIEYKKKIGDLVKEDEPILVLEAMKMYNNLYSPCDGVITEIEYKAGDIVPKNAVLCVIRRNE